MPAAATSGEPLATLREADFDRFLQVLLAHAADRAALLALFHFNLELARVADQVREPMAGLIRLQWWRDAIARIDVSDGAAHPTLELMVAADLPQRLGATTLVALIDARERELDATPLRHAGDVEVHARATAGALNRAVGALTGANDIDAAGDVGTAYGLLGIVRAVPFVMRRAQPLLPEGALVTGSTEDAAGGGDGRASLQPVLVELVARAQTILDAVPRNQPRRAAPAFVPAVLARQDLRRLSRMKLDVFDGRLATRPPWTTARCLAAALLRRFG